MDEKRSGSSEGSSQMSDEPRRILDSCWEEIASSQAAGAGHICRWCHHVEPGMHHPDCPCVALSLALEQRDALASYVRAERRNMVLQGAFRVAHGPAKADTKRRRDEAALLLEAASARLRDLGIEDMVRWTG